MQILWYGFGIKQHFAALFLLSLQRWNANPAEACIQAEPHFLQMPSEWAENTD